MSKTIKINGEFTIEELQEKIKEFNKPVWEVKLDSFKDISIYKNGKQNITLLDKDKEVSYCNLSIVSREMARMMGDLMETKDVLDKNIFGYSIYYDAQHEEWKKISASVFTNDKHFKTKETAKLAAKLLNESKDMEDWIERMSE